MKSALNAVRQNLLVLAGVATIKTSVNSRATAVLLVQVAAKTAILTTHQVRSIGKSTCFVWDDVVRLMSNFSQYGCNFFNIIIITMI